MPLLIQYILKLFISLAVVYLFYQLVLRRLTFYSWNRWYLLGYSILSFVIPFVNITPALQDNQISNNGVIGLITPVEAYTTGIERATLYSTSIWSSQWDKWDWSLFVLLSGAVLLSIRLFIRWVSFLQMRRKAKMISDKDMKIYQVDKDIIPFSFGNSIFINCNLHDKGELQEIIRHEFVHVKQKHTHDIIWGELLCILNWYNPFAWMLRRAMRQNLEFIADQQVIQAGLDRKQYQYLLLKVIGNKHFSIANQFNFSSLKKRIAMMNKMKTARVHLFKFLFLLPMLAIMLLAFRARPTLTTKSLAFESGAGENKQTDSPGKTLFGVVTTDQVKSVRDTVPDAPINAKGYYLDIIDNDGTCIVVVKDKNRKEVERLPLTKWTEKESYYENLYGIIHPVKPPTPVNPVNPPAKPEPPVVAGIKNTDAKTINTRHKGVVVITKDGKTETYDLNDPKEKEAFEKKYGNKPSPPNPPAPPAKPAAPRVTVSRAGEPGPVRVTEPRVSVSRAVDARVTHTAEVSTTQTVNIENKPYDVQITKVEDVTYDTKVEIVEPKKVDIKIEKSKEPVKKIDIKKEENPGSPDKSFKLDPNKPGWKIKPEPSLTKKNREDSFDRKLDNMMESVVRNGGEIKFDKIEFNTSDEKLTLSGTLKKTFHSNSEKFSISTF